MWECTHEPLLRSHFPHARVVVVEEITTSSVPGSGDELGGCMRREILFQILFQGSALALTGKDAPQKGTERCGNTAVRPKHLRD
jgi:hypothetical protein